MRRSAFYIILFSLISVFALSQVSYAYWIWTPETKKFTNPKNAVKDTPKEQFEWAMSFYSAKDYQRAAFEFDKLAKQYEFSDYASKAQYYVGLCYEDMQKYYTAFENYQKAIDNFPHLSNTDEVLAREYAIGNIYLEKQNPKVLGNDIMAPLDRAIEIFKKVVDNAPYGKYAQDAQFKLGEALKKSERYEEAVQAYHKLAEDYPNSKYATKAMYEEADCAYRASLKPAYDAGATDSAIKTFEKFTDKNKDAKLAQDADRTMRRLKDSVAEKSFKAAEFYESQGKTQAAIIYYQDVIDTYPDSSYVNRSKAKIEALSKPKKTIALPVLDFDKKKPNPVAKEAPKKKPWSPLDFSSKKSQSKEQVSSKTQESPKKKSWNPLDFSSKKPQSKEQPSPVTQETPKKKGWEPLSFFGAKKKPAAKETPAPTPPIQTPAPVAEEPELATKVVTTTAPEPVPQAPQAPAAEPATQAPVDEQTTQAPPAPVVSETVSPAEPPKIASDTQITETQEVPKKKTWSPLDFSSKKPQGKEEAVTAAPQIPKKKSWNPFDFNNKKTQAKEQASTTTQETPKKKGWEPFNFFGAKKESANKEIPKKKEWKPLSFDTRKKETPAPVAPVLPEPPKVEPTTQVVAAPEPAAPQAPAIEPETKTTQTPVVSEVVAPAPEPPKVASDTQIVQTQETPKVKGWTPFNFDDKKEAVVKEAPKKKSWNPFNFDNKKEDSVNKEVQKKKVWKPLNFGTNDQPMEGLR